MSNLVSSLTYAGSVEVWGDRLRLDNSLISIPLARASEKVVSHETALVQRFTLLLERIRKTVDRVTLLGNVMRWGPTLLENEEIKAQVVKICPDTTKIDDALESQNQRLNSLQREIIQWTFLQPHWQALDENQVFQMIQQVVGTLTSKIKWIQDPTIPFIKMAVEERAKWLCEKIPLEKIMDKIDEEVELIFAIIPEMYYNTFLGASHPKVRANIVNQNDLVKITEEDVRDHILNLLLKPLEDKLQVTESKSAN